MTESTALTTTTSNNQALAFLHDGAALDHRSRANKSGLLQDPISWKTKGQGDALEVTATAVMRETGEVITATVTMKEAAADGWTRNPKYKSIPEQMLRWRAATRLINLYIPEVLFGLGVREEAEMRPVTVPITDRCDCNSIDLSAGATWRLGIPLDGIATVSIHY